MGGRLPDFYLIGAPKCGTTSMYHALHQHPGLFVSDLKEPHYFVTDDRPTPTVGPGDEGARLREVWRRADYEALYAAAPVDSLCGDCTTHYLGHEAALQRLHAATPHARLIAILRDPVDRAWSNWASMWPYREPERDIIKACRAEPQRLAAGWNPFWGYVTYSQYGRGLQNVYRLFPRERVLLLLFDDVIACPREALERVTNFLGVAAFDPSIRLPHANAAKLLPPDALTGLEWWARRRNVRKVVPAPLRRRLLMLRRRSGRNTGPPPRVRRQLVPWFADDIRLTYELTGLPVLDWLRA